MAELTNSNIEEILELEVKLDLIPRKLKLCGKEYNLQGIIQYYAPALSRRHSDHQTIGHYTCIALRKNNTWKELDDQKPTK